MQVDLAKQTDAELVKLQTGSRTSGTCGMPGGCCRSGPRSRMEGRSGPRGASGDADGERTARAATPAGLWACTSTGGLDASDSLGRSTTETSTCGRGRSSSVRERASRRPSALTKYELWPQSDPSPVVRLYLASALQRLPSSERWAIAERSAEHATDAKDANLPLMYWYGIEPLVASRPGKGRSRLPARDPARPASSSPGGSSDADWHAKEGRLRPWSRR